MTPPTDEYFGRVRTEIAPLIPPDRGGTVLEIGCGMGQTMAWLKTIRPIRYAAAVELFPDAATWARNVFDEVEVGRIETSRLAFREDKFDLVIALDVLEHLEDPYSVVDRLRERMKPDGLFVASIPNIAHYSVSLPLLTRGRWNYADHGLLDRTHLRFFTAPSIRALFADRGFTDVVLTANPALPNVFALFGGRSQRWRWYSQRLLRPFLKWPSHLFALQFLVAARRG